MAMSSSSIWSVPAPLGEALAQDQAGVGEVQQVLQHGSVGSWIELAWRAYMWPTESGIW